MVSEQVEETAIWFEPDFDGVNGVDAQDLMLLLGAWGSDHHDCDLNGDGVVNGHDLAGLLAAWSSTP